MLYATLDTVRRLIGASCRGIAFADTATQRVSGTELIYRLKSWPELPETERTAEVYRLLSVMSSRPVNRQWMHSRSRLAGAQLDALLRRLCDEDALEVIDPAQFARRQALQG